MLQPYVHVVNTLGTFHSCLDLRWGAHGHVWQLASFWALLRHTQPVGRFNVIPHGMISVARRCFRASLFTWSSSGELGVLLLWTIWCFTMKKSLQGHHMAYEEAFCSYPPSSSTSDTKMHHSLASRWTDLNKISCTWRWKSNLSEYWDSIFFAMKTEKY